MVWQRNLSEAYISFDLGSHARELVLVTDVALVVGHAPSLGVVHVADIEDGH